jgi:hypothetical protein
MVHAALLLMLEAVTTNLVFTISLKRSTLNIQLSTSWAGRLPHLSRRCQGYSGHKRALRNGVDQMLGIAKKEATAGPPLPFGPMVIGATK